MNTEIEIKFCYKIHLIEKENLFSFCWKAELFEYHLKMTEEGYSQKAGAWGQNNGGYKHSMESKATLLDWLAKIIVEID